MNVFNIGKWLGVRNELIYSKGFFVLFFFKNGCFRLDLKLKWWLEQEERIFVMFRHFLTQPPVQSCVPRALEGRASNTHLFLSGPIFAVSTFVWFFPL